MTAKNTYYWVPPPEMHITTTPKPPGIPDHHELKGWDNLDQWGRWHHSQWANIQRRTEWDVGMSEIDKLRLLAGEMLRLNVELVEERHRASLSPCPVLVVKPPQAP